MAPEQALSLVDKLLTEGEHAEVGTHEVEDAVLEKAITDVKSRTIVDRERLLTNINAWRARNEKKETVRKQFDALGRLKANINLDPLSTLAGATVNLGIDAGKRASAAFDKNAPTEEKNKMRALIASPILAIAGFLSLIGGMGKPKKRMKMHVDPKTGKETVEMKKDENGKDVPDIEEYYTWDQKFLKFFGIAALASSLGSFLYGAAGAREAQTAKAKKESDAERAKAKSKPPASTPSSAPDARTA